MNFRLPPVPTYGAYYSATSLVKTYTTLIGDQKVDVLFNKVDGLRAIVSRLNDQGKVISSSAPLPLSGLAKEVVQQNNLKRLTRFFKHVYLIPEKGVEGDYTSVSVRVTGKGGVEAKIPYQDGLSLGGTFSGDTLDQLVNYAEAVAEGERIEEQFKSTEQRIALIENKMSSVSPDSVLFKLYSAEMKRLQFVITNLTAKIEAGTTTEINPPILPNFHQAMESPLDMQRTKIDRQDRAFETVHFSSQYISTSQNKEASSDKASHSSSSSSVSAGGGSWFVSAKAAYSWSEANSKRIAEIKKEGKTETVLMISAVFTTRHVQTLVGIHYDLEKVQSYLNLLDPSHDLTDQDAKRFGITKRKVTVDPKGKQPEGQPSAAVVQEKREVYVLTEAVMGGSFTAFVSFLQENKDDQNIKSESAESSHGGSGSVGFSAYGIDVSGGFATSNQSGSKSNDDSLDSLKKSKIQIDFISQGAFPTFVRKELESEMLQYGNRDLSTYKPTEQSKEDLKNMQSINTAVREEATVALQAKLVESMVTNINATRSVTAVKDKVSLNTVESVLEAYDSFASKMVQDPGTGIPIGFNYRVYDIDNLSAIRDELVKAKVDMAAAEVEANTKAAKAAAAKTIEDANEYAATIKADALKAASKIKADAQAAAADAKTKPDADAAADAKKKSDADAAAAADAKKKSDADAAAAADAKKKTDADAAAADAADAKKKKKPVATTAAVGSSSTSTTTVGDTD